MKEFLHFLISQLVEKPEAVKITEEKLPSSLIIYHLTVHPNDMGRVIGKEGKIIKSIRTLMKIKAIKEGIHFSLDLKEAS